MCATLSIVGSQLPIYGKPEAIAWERRGEEGVECAAIVLRHHWYQYMRCHGDTLHNTSPTEEVLDEDSHHMYVQAVTQGLVALPQRCSVGEGEVSGEAHKTSHLARCEVSKLQRSEASHTLPTPLPPETLRNLIRPKCFVQLLRASLVEQHRPCAHSVVCVSLREATALGGLGHGYVQGHGISLKDLWRHQVLREVCLWYGMEEVRQWLWCGD